MNSKNIVRYLVSFSLLALIALQVDFDVLMSKTSDSNMGLMVMAMLAVIMQIVFLNLRWHSLLNAGRQNVSFQTSVIINLAGYFANVMFITSIGGIIAKSGLAIRQGLSFVHAVFVTFLDRFMTLGALIILTAISLPVLSGVLDQKIENMLILSVSVIILAIVTFLGALRSGFLKDFILSNRSRSRFVATLRTITENPALMTRTTIYSVVAQIFFFISVLILSSGMSYSGSTLSFLALLPVLALISSLPISFGGWGVREGAFIYGLGLIGFSIEDAFLLSVQVGLVTMVAPFVFCLPYIFNDKVDLSKLLKASRS